VIGSHTPGPTKTWTLPKTAPKRGNFKTQKSIELAPWHVRTSRTTALGKGAPQKNSKKNRTRERKNGAESGAEQPATIFLQQQAPSTTRRSHKNRLKNRSGKRQAVSALQPSPWCFTQG